VQRLDPLDKYLESAKNRPDVAALRQNIIAEEHSVNLQKGAFLPTVGLDGDYYLQRSGSSADSKWAAVLSLDFPIFQGGSTLAQVRLEQSRLRQTQQLLEQALRQLNTQVKSLYKSLDFSIRQAAAYQDAYTKAQKSYLAQLRDYRFGLVTNLDVIQAMLDMLASKRNFDRAVIQVKIDKSLLDIAAMQ
jgi:outer membrane protein TolC